MDKLFLRIAPQCEGEVAPFVQQQNDWVSVELTERSERVRQERCATLSMRRDWVSSMRLCWWDRFEWWSVECSRVLLSVCWSSLAQCQERESFYPKWETSLPCRFQLTLSVRMHELRSLVIWAPGSTSEIHKWFYAYLIWPFLHLLTLTVLIIIKKWIKNIFRLF